jgi:hypothetical protein
MQSEASFLYARLYPTPRRYTLTPLSRGVRVQAKGERCYHVFYQLCAGADPSMRAAMGLQPAASYRYLANGECIEIKGMDDAKEFRELCACMTAVGITVADQQQVCVGPAYQDLFDAIRGEEGLAWEAHAAVKRRPPTHAVAIEPKPRATHTPCKSGLWFKGRSLSPCQTPIVRFAPV